MDSRKKPGKYFDENLGFVANGFQEKALKVFRRKLRVCDE